MLLISLNLVSAAVANDAPSYSDPVLYIKIAGYFILALSLFVVTIGKKLALTHKTFFFLLFVIPALLSSLYLAGHTVHGNIISETKGPVHWHADYEVWACGEKLDLIDPTGLKNKIGTPLFHEHNDDRIHVEGTVFELADVNLGEYFKVIGGELHADKISYVDEYKGPVSYSNGDTCPDGSIGELAVYVNGNRVNNPQEHVLSPEIFVPNGDCIIFEFGSNLGESTERLCLSWESKEAQYGDVQAYTFGEDNPNEVRN